MSRLARPASSRSRVRPQASKLRFEPLEERRLLAVSTAFFDDQWASVIDNAPSGLSVGDLVNNGISGNGSIAAIYGEDAFGSVMISGTPTSLSGSATINDAIDNTTIGGTTWIIHAASSSGVDVDQDVRLVGELTISSGDLTMTDSDAVISLEGASELITLSDGDLDLSAGKLYLGIDDTGQADSITVNGSVSLSNVALQIAFGDHPATVGTEYVIIDNLSNDPVTGTFASLAQDDTFPVGDRTLQIDYSGGDGNDVVLRLTSEHRPFTSYVNDNWYDANGGALEPGDPIDDRNDTGGTPSVSTYFEDATLDEIFESGFYTAGYDDLQAAIDATAEGGIVNVLPGSYAAPVSGEVVISKDLALQGNFTLAGALVVDNAPLTLLVGGDFGTISLEGLELSPDSNLRLRGTPDDSDLIEVDGDIELNGANLDLSWLGDATANVLLIDNQGSDSDLGTFAGLPEGAELFLEGQKFWITYSGGDGNDVELVIPDSTVAARHLFYKNSVWDDPTFGFTNDSAIAPDKEAYLPGSASTIANVTSYSKGINGIMVDLAGSHPDVTASDFFFQVGNNNAPSTWATAPAPASVTVRSGAGVSGSDRIDIIWADGAIEDEWLRVVVLSTLNTALASPDEFYFGNKIGDTFSDGDPTAAITDATDQIQARNNQGVALSMTNVYDFDRDAFVDASDQLIARNNQGFTPLISVAAPPSVPLVSAPTVWYPDQSVTVVAAAPVLADGTIDEDITGMNFYLDVNGNGVLDPSDELLAEGEEVFDDDDNFAGWRGAIDPSELGPGPVEFLVVPQGPNGSVGGGFQQTANMQDDDAANAAVQLINIGSLITAQVVLMSFGISPVSVVTAAPSALATSSGFFVAQNQIATEWAGASVQVIDGPVAQVIAHVGATGSSIATTGQINQNASSFAYYDVYYQITSPAPAGSPVRIAVNALGYSYASTLGTPTFPNATTNSRSVVVGGDSPPTTLNTVATTGLFSVGAVFIGGANTRVVMARVGEVIRVTANPGGLGLNAFAATISNSTAPLNQAVADSLSVVYVSQA